MKGLKKILKSLGPGFITGASDDDPSGIATYSQTGALFGFSQAWTALFSFPLMTAVQEMCGRIGLVTGHGIAGVIKRYYSKKLLFFAVMLLFLANTINIGADLGAMAESAQLLFGLPFYVWLLVIVILTLSLEIFVSYKVYAQYLKFLTFTLFAYVITAFVVVHDFRAVLSSTFFPTFQLNREFLLNIIAVLGTTISPYLFFWQAGEEVEEEVAHHKLRSFGAGQPRVTPKDISRLRIDTVIGMFFSNVIMFFIIVTTGATLFPNGIHKIESAAQAASVLRPLAGDFAFLLFALGILGTGLLAVPVLSGSASYALSEAFGWKVGLYRKLRAAKGFYGTIALATLLGVAMNAFGFHSITFLYYTAVINGIIAPPLLVIILLIANNKKIMGNRVNNWILNVLGVVTVLIMSSAVVLLIIL